MPEKPAHSILKVLAYFDIFQYPLTKDEIYFFLGQQMHPDEVQPWLEQMTAQQQIFRLGDFYSLQNNPALYDRRMAGNTKARNMLPLAYRAASFFFRFPFVRGISISGSLSKNMADDASDIDLFIITSGNRLWIARTCMYLFRRFTYLTGNHHLYCLNYFVDEESQCIEEQNIFTATELNTLIPVCGNGAIERFFDSNKWTSQYLPNMAVGKKALLANPPSRVKKFIEWILDNRLGEAIDNYLLRFTSHRWQRREEERRMNPKGYPMSMIYNKHVAKPNPAHFHQKVLDAYQQKVKQVEDKVKVLDDMLI